MLDNLTDPEQALVTAARDGTVLVCGDDRVRAGLIRELLLGRRGELDPRGVRISGATINGTLDLSGSVVRNDTGPALHADGLTVGADLVLDRARVSGTAEEGAIRLASARLGDGVSAVDTEVGNDAGPAIHADGLHVENTILLLDARLSGKGDGGALWLLGAHLGGLRVVNTLVRNDSGPALFADQLQTGGLVHLERVRLFGTGDHATVRLAAATIGRLTLIAATIDNPAGPLLDLHTTTVAGSAHVPTETIYDETHCGPSTVNLADFTYGSLPHVRWRQWLHLIRRHTKEYRPSPYQRLAAVERAAGHDGNARHILIAQQDDLRRRAPAALGGRLTRWFHWLWGALAGCGYRARRTALALLAALATAGLVSFWAGHVPTGPGRYAAEPHTQCSTVELIGLGLDRGLPLGPTGLRTRCDLDTESTAGQLFTVLLWIVQAAVWGLATLAIAGYTGLIRKTA